jgi:fumarate reductase subunit D
MAKSNEPFWWALFGAGGMIAALFLPVTIVITCILVMINPAHAEGLRTLFAKPLVRLYLFVIISLPLFHWAHRFRFTLVDLGLKAAKGPIAVFCYGAAIAGSLIAALLLLGIWSG